MLMMQAAGAGWYYNTHQVKCIHGLVILYVLVVQTRRRNGIADNISLYGMQMCCETLTYMASSSVLPSFLPIHAREARSWWYSLSLLRLRRRLADSSIFLLLEGNAGDAGFTLAANMIGQIL